MRYPADLTSPVYSCRRQRAEQEASGTHLLYLSTSFEQGAPLRLLPVRSSLVRVAGEDLLKMNHDQRPWLVAEMMDADFLS